MRAWKAIVVLAGIGAAVWYAPEFAGRFRGVEVMESPVPTRIASAESAGLFIGVRDFEYAVQVPYAVDDAVDLAYFFALDPRGAIVAPSRVVLALSGTPQKSKSKERLEALRAANARIVEADSANIINLLEEQTARVGKDGALVVSISTHGFAQDGVPHILGRSSRFENPRTAVSLADLLDAGSHSVRSIFFIDSCRERITETRSGSPQPVTRAPLLEKMARYNGQVVFYAAASGGYAYDSHADKNGVFTTAVLDGLRCGATATRETILARTLNDHVERSVRRWLKEHGKPLSDPVTQFSFEGTADRLPLAECPPPPSLMTAEVKGSIVVTTDEFGRTKTRPFDGPVAAATTSDLDADGKNEMIVRMDKTLSVIDHEGTELWRKSAPMPLVDIAIDVRSRGIAQKQIVVLWSNEKTSRLVSYNAAGNTLETFDAADGFRMVMLYRPTRQFNPRIVAAGPNGVQLFGKKSESWRKALPSPPLELKSADCNHDKKDDILITLAKGRTQCFSVRGDLLPH